MIIVNEENESIFWNPKSGLLNMHKLWIRDVKISYRLLALHSWIFEAFPALYPVNFFCFSLLISVLSILHQFNTHAGYREQTFNYSYT